MPTEEEEPILTWVAYVVTHDSKHRMHKRRLGRVYATNHPRALRNAWIEYRITRDEDRRQISVVREGSPLDFETKED